jgi:uncharacterized protein RhaS with RHS repeats
MRDYDPTTGRYIQADPLGLVDGASVYGYARQNPVKWTDPKGLRISPRLPSVPSPKPPQDDFWCANTQEECDWQKEYDDDRCWAKYKEGVISSINGCLDRSRENWRRCLAGEPLLPVWGEEHEPTVDGGDREPMPGPPRRVSPPTPEQTTAMGVIMTIILFIGYVIISS